MGADTTQVTTPLTHRARFEPKPGPRRATGAASQMLDLHRAAGNRAVWSVLGVQRLADPAAGSPTLRRCSCSRPSSDL